MGVRFSALIILFFRPVTGLHYLLMYPKVKRILEESIAPLTTGGVWKDEIADLLYSKVNETNNHQMDSGLVFQNSVF